MNRAEFVLVKARGDLLAQRSGYLFQRQEAEDRGDVSTVAVYDTCLDQLDADVADLTAAIRAAFPAFVIEPMPARPERIPTA